MLEMMKQAKRFAGIGEIGECFGFDMRNRWDICFELEKQMEYCILEL